MLVVAVEILGRQWRNYVFFTISLPPRIEFLRLSIIACSICQTLNISVDYNCQRITDNRVKIPRNTQVIAIMEYLIQAFLLSAKARAPYTAAHMPLHIPTPPSKTPTGIRNIMCQFCILPSPKEYPAHSMRLPYIMISVRTMLPHVI